MHNPVVLTYGVEIVFKLAVLHFLLNVPFLYFHFYFQSTFLYAFFV
jgi:hypothetical protein